MKQGYSKVELKLSSCELTVFAIGDRFYEFIRLPFGLTNGPKSFAKITYTLFGGVNQVKTYIKDILIYTSTKQEHIKKIKELLEILEKENIVVNFEKSCFLKQRVNFLGYILTSEGVQADTSRVEGLELKIPKTKKHIMKIVGFCNWFKEHIPHLLELLLPITKKLKNKTIIWITQDSEHLKEIYNKSKQAVLLSYPNDNDPYELFTDASDYAISGILKQGKRTVGLYSKKLTIIQTKWTIIEKECFAIIEALQHFKPLIFGKRIKVKPITTIFCLLRTAARREWKDDLF